MEVVVHTLVHKAVHKAVHTIVHKAVHRNLVADCNLDCRDWEEAGYKIHSLYEVVLGEEDKHKIHWEEDNLTFLLSGKKDNGRLPFLCDLLGLF